MNDGKRDEKLWTALETAVRTYGEELPVDAFLPPPESRIWCEPEGMHAREADGIPLERRFDPPLGMEPGMPFPEETDFDTFDALADDIDIIDEELRHQLEG